MTKQHFVKMAAMIRAMNNGEWTDELPEWADLPDEDMPTADDNYHLRAVQTAEFCILLAESFNPRFNRKQFLTACGLR